MDNWLLPRIVARTSSPGADVEDDRNDSGAVLGTEKLMPGSVLGSRASAAPRQVLGCEGIRQFPLARFSTHHPDLLGMSVTWMWSRSMMSLGGSGPGILPTKGTGSISRSPVRPQRGGSSRFQPARFVSVMCPRLKRH